MRQLRLAPALHWYDDCMAFVSDFTIGPDDLILTARSIFKPYFGEMNLRAQVLFMEEYGDGPPSDEMAEALYAAINRRSARVVAIGDGTVLDMAKIYALRNVSPVLDLLDGKLEILKDKKLVLVPTTCGAGNEVTNTTVLEMKTRRTLRRFVRDELFADSAVLIPQLLEGLPYSHFVAGSVIALAGAVDSLLSSRATPYTSLLAEKSLRTLLAGYQVLFRDGEIARVPLSASFLQAANLAGIAVATTGRGLAQALAAPIARSNGSLPGIALAGTLVRILNAYKVRIGGGAVARLNGMVADALGCSVKNAHATLDQLLHNVLKLNGLKNQRLPAKDINVLVDNAVSELDTQSTKLVVPFARDDIEALYRSVL